MSIFEFLFHSLDGCRSVMQLSAELGCYLHRCCSNNSLGNFVGWIVPRCSITTDGRVGCSAPLLILPHIVVLLYHERYCEQCLEMVLHAVAEWLRAWDTLTMFEATVCGRS